MDKVSNVRPHRARRKVKMFKKVEGAVGADNAVPSRRSHAEVVRANQPLRYVTYDECVPELSAGNKGSATTAELTAGRQAQFAVTNERFLELI